MATLGVNIDHVATLRQQRGTTYPDPVDAAVLAQLAGADQITVHLREDRRHICDRDVFVLRQILHVPLNLEIANTPEMLEIALNVKPNIVTLVPEKREERTTEGGLNLSKFKSEIKKTVTKLQSNNIPVSLFVEPSPEDIDLCKEIGAKMIELHTGRYSELEGKKADSEFVRISSVTELALGYGLIVHVGHGLNYRNIKRIAQIKGISDLNIGHSIVARAVLVGIDRAVREMKELIGVCS